ncbi:LOW QUALITY PROTEIN: uncharacterized protein CXorf38 homolog [Colossoma macropomum]|uniref:LOW QUALITY PROTEIN: uncharacterized protein CXorf38 homolog n=1 Tax=Colossoma macropomum TaxID=42526 RepID=UPI001864E4CC|nr:LOW QUALITY PROTEIN: uncharacterized protein CXorf38 homolog [Colossoma macropomum]
MVHEELFARLNEVGYKNWLKAGYCLLKVRDGLCGFADNEMRSFHNTVVRNNTVLRRGQPCRSNCRPRGNQFQSACPVCSEWQREILRHHTKPCSMINWGNCRPWLWPTEHWELAKAFMPRGLADANRAEHCDAAALLNLLHFCDHFSFINQGLVTEVIRCRNELMHSCEMQVSDQWMGRFQKSLQQLLIQLHHVPEVAAAGQQIREMLSVDLSVHVPGVDSVDGHEIEGVGIESISQWETELLRESLKDLLDNDDLVPVDLKKVQIFHRFLSGHKDLEEQFKTELQSMQVLEEKLQRSLNSKES